MGDQHRPAIERSLALHREVARRIRDEPSVLEGARSRVASWLAEGAAPGSYAQAWEEILSLPAEQVALAIVQDTEAAHDLRQASPFAGVIDARTRWRILRGVADGRP